MGTSSSSAGPKTPEWTAAKAAATRLARGRAGSSPESVVRSAARAIGSGGGGSGGGWSANSSRAAQRMGALLAGATTQALDETARQLGISELEGRSPGDALLQILEWVASDGTTLEEQSARRAAEQVLSELVNAEPDPFDSPLESEAAIELFRQFLVEYLVRVMLTHLAPRLTENENAQRAKSHELEMRRVVDAVVNLELEPGRFVEIDWLGAEGATTVNDLRDQALDLLSGD